MASLDKSSVRNEISRLKADFEKLCAEGKITSESQTIMNSLFMLVELILAIFLERTTKKDTTNSSKPSSQTDKDESALGHTGSNGKGKPENKATAHNSRKVETVTLSKVQTCAICGEDLTGVPCTHQERRTKIDIVFEKVVEHVDAEV
jgi:transposase